jgi:hypothetical protein
MGAPYDLRSQQDADASAYAALPGTSAVGFIPHHMTPMKSLLAPGRDIPGMLNPLARNVFLLMDHRMPSESMDIRAVEQQFYNLRPIRPCTPGTNRFTIHLGSSTQISYQRKPELFYGVHSNSFCHLPRLPFSLRLQDGMG